MSIFKQIASSFKKPSKATQPTEIDLQGASTHGLCNIWGKNDLETSVMTTNKNWLDRYHNMIENDSLVRAFASTLQLLISSMKFSLKCDDDNEEYREIAEQMFLDWGKGDFNEFCRQYVSTFLMGFSLFEMVLRRGETGYELDDMVFHPQVYLLAKWSDFETLQGFESRFGREPILLSRCLYAQGIGNFNYNVYGQSLMRSAYIHYRNKIEIMGSEMYHVKANLEGIPIIHLDTKADNWKKVWTDIQYSLQNIKKGIGTALMLPSATFEDNDNKPSNVRKNDIRLMSVEGSKFIDTNELIKREDNAIARALMAEFLVMVGQDSGSYALSKETTSMFKLIVEGIAQHLCDTFTHQVMKPLWVLNGQPFEYLPELTYDSVDLTLDGMATFINALSGAGIVLTQSQEDYLFEYGGLPKPEAEERLKLQEDALMMNPMIGTPKPLLDDELADDAE
jgi:hypothetical protein